MIESMKTISGLCLIIILAGSISLLEQIFPIVEAWFYSYVGWAGLSIVIDLLFLLAFITKTMRWLNE